MVKKLIVKKAKVAQKSKSDILSRVKPVSETESLVTALFYGRSGTGKTTLSSTFPKPLLLLDFRDRGTDSIKDVEDIEVIYIDNWDGVEEMYWALRGGEHKYKSVVLDTISGMQSIIIEEVKKNHKIKPEDTLSRRNWGEVGGTMNQWLMNYRDLDMNVVFLAADRTKNTNQEEGESGYEEGQLEPEVGPAVIPSVASKVNAAVKILGNTYIRQTKKFKEGKTVIQTSYRLRIGPHPFYVTKIRSPREFLIPGSIINPTFNKINKIMKGEK